MGQILQIAGAALAGSALYFAWRGGNTDAVYITAVLGAVLFFLGVRFQAKARNTERENERLAAAEQEISQPPAGDDGRTQE